MTVIMRTEGSRGHDVRRSDAAAEESWGHGHHGGRAGAGYDALPTMVDWRRCRHARPIFFGAQVVWRKRRHGHKVSDSLTDLKHYETNQR